MIRKTAEFSVDSLPPEMPYSGPVNDVELAHEMAFAMDADETKRAEWKAFAEDLEQSTEPAFGSVNRPRKSLIRLAEDALDLPDSFGLSDEVKEGMSPKAWIRQQVSMFHDNRRGSIFADVQKQHRETFGSSKTVIPTELVAFLAKRVSKSHGVASNYKGNLVYFRHQAAVNIATIQEHLEEGDEQVYARVDRREFRFPSYFLSRRDEIPKDIDVLDEHLAKLKDVHRRKQAYKKLAEFFGQEVRPGSVERQDVIRVFDLMCDFEEIDFKRY